MSEPVALLVSSLCKSRLGCAKLGAWLNVVSAVALATEKGCFADERWNLPLVEFLNPIPTHSI